MSNVPLHTAEYYCLPQ